MGLYTRLSGFREGSQCRFEFLAALVDLERVQVIDCVRLPHGQQRPVCGCRLGETAVVKRPHGGLRVKAVGALPVKLVLGRRMIMLHAHEPRVHSAVAFRLLSCRRVPLVLSTATVVPFPPGAHRRRPLVCIVQEFTAGTVGGVHAEASQACVGRRMAAAAWALPAAPHDPSLQLTLCHTKLRDARCVGRCSSGLRLRGRGALACPRRPRLWCTLCANAITAFGSVCDICSTGGGRQRQRVGRFLVQLIRGTDQ